MKSGKQRRAEIGAKRKKRAAKRALQAKLAEPSSDRMIPVNEALLAPNNSYGVPDFVRRGYYVNISFRCVDCAIEETWTGTQQKLWYEVAKASFIQRPSVADHAGAKNERGAMKRAGFIFRAWRKSSEMR